MKNKGFTLIELLVVVAIVGALAAVGVVAYNGYTAAAKKNSAKSSVVEFNKSLGDFARSLYKKITTIVDTAISRNANINCDAPTAIPTQIDSSKKARLYGSFTAVLNLTTDRAPTRPNDSAKDDFTIAIREATLSVTIKIVFPKDNLEEYVLENLPNKYLK